MQIRDCPLPGTATIHILGAISPLQEMQSLVTRTEPDFHPGSTALCEPAPWISDGKLLTAEEVLRMMTVNSAYALDRDTEVDSIKQGKLADLGNLCKSHERSIWVRNSQSLCRLHGCR
ncbi:MAG: hypothetical protein OEQ39_17420, partial [Gammaproteobacteria bacterium]|nr:hypothetical protein [Gammaproteobacteria bacterium]